MQTFCAFLVQNLITIDTERTGKAIRMQPVRTPPEMDRRFRMPTENGLIEISSGHGMDETMRRLQGAFVEKGMQVFAVIDHSGEAEKVGLKMRPTKVIIFGSPKGGTPLMVAAPSVAIDLPLKALVAESADRKVSVTYNDPAYLQKRHGVPAELVKNLAGAGALIAKAVE
jgi:uncharacterized protein (DUF302 family)